MLTSTVSDQGQTTVPAGIRKALKTPPGTVLAWAVNGSTAEVVPLTRANVRKQRTCDYEACLKSLRESPAVTDDLLVIRRSKEPKMGSVPHFRMFALFRLRCGPDGTPPNSCQDYAAEPASEAAWRGEDCVECSQRGRCTPSTKPAWPITRESAGVATLLPPRVLRLANPEYCPIIRTMSAQEMLIEEIKHQPEPVLREVLHYLKFLERQRAQEDWADVLPSREVEQEKLDILDGK